MGRDSGAGDEVSGSFHFPLKGSRSWIPLPGCKGESLLISGHGGWHFSAFSLAVRCLSLRDYSPGAGMVWYGPRDKLATPRQQRWTCLETGLCARSRDQQRRVLCAVAIRCRAPYPCWVVKIHFKFLVTCAEYVPCVCDGRGSERFDLCGRFAWPEPEQS